jgi:ParB-like chromosome segregation protein Spo0J
LPGPQYGSPQHVAQWKAFDRRVRPHEDRMKRQLKRDFQQQQNEVLRALREGKGLEYARLLSSRSKASPDEIPDIKDLLDWAKEVERFARGYRVHYEDVMRDLGEEQLAALGLTISFDLKDPRVSEAIPRMLIRFAQDINQTTQDRMAAAMREILLEAEEAGWGIPQIQERVYDRISQVYNVRKADYETERIARTEMIKAANMGSQEGMRQSGMVQRKGWLAALDDRTRLEHIQAHEHYNEVGVALDAPFPGRG